MNVTGFLLFIGFGAAFTYLVVRSRMVTDFRRKWMDPLKKDPEAIYLFHRHVPSYRRMLFSFRPLTDRNWIPAKIRAARYRAELEKDVRQALDKWMEAEAEKNKKPTDSKPTK